MGLFTSRTSTPVVPLPVVQVPLDRIVICRASGVTEAWVERSSTRLSDRLNRGAPIDIRMSLTGPAQPLATDDVIALAVPLAPTPSPNRMARRRHILELTAGPYLLRGVVHMPAGADPARYLRATPQRWTALTHATLLRPNQDDGDEFDVLLVNMEHVARPN